MIDDTDKKILTILQKNARIPNAQIAREVGCAPSCIHERLRKLEDKGIIAGYHARLNAGKLGFGVTAYMFIRSDDRVGAIDTAERLAEIPEVEEVHNIAGEDCYLVKVRCANNEELGRLLREKVGVIEAVRTSRTSIVLNTVKECGSLPLE